MTVLLLKPKEEDKGPFKNHAGLGDTVAAVTQATGIRAIVDAGSRAFNKPCGCKKEKNFK